jgi:hypothetical protein
MLVQITSPWFCAGVVVGETAAPIVKYMATWSLEAIEAYCRKRSWHLTIVEDLGVR